jgi:hypothetical protein
MVDRRVAASTEPEAEAQGSAERRAPTVARALMPLRAEAFREAVSSFEADLRELDSRDRRLVRVLVSRLAAQWIARYGPSHRSLLAEVALADGTLRVDVRSEPPTEDAEFWAGLINRDVEDVVTPWSVDRRRAAGVWFELAR